MTRHLMRRLWWATLPYYGWTCDYQAPGANPAPWWAWPLAWVNRLTYWLFFRRRDVFGPLYNARKSRSPWA